MSSSRDAALADALAVALAEYSDRSLGRILGRDHKTALVRKTDLSTWLLNEISTLADSDNNVRMAVLARFGDQTLPTETAEKAAEETIQDAGAVIQGLMQDLAGDHRITPHEAQRRLVAVQQLEEHVISLRRSLQQLARVGGRRDR